MTHPTDREQPDRSEPRMRLSSPAVVFTSGVFAAVWLGALVLAWAFIAGQAGSPRPDNWATLKRVLDIVGAGIPAFLMLLALAPPVAIVARDGKRWAGIYPLLVMAACAVQAALCLYALAGTPRQADSLARFMAGLIAGDTARVTGPAASSRA